MMNKYPLSRRSDLVVQDVSDETLIYDLNDNRVLCLNKTSTLIWEMCDGKRSIADICAALSDKTTGTIDEGLVWLALEQLKKENLIESEVTAPPAYAGLSRRDVIKRVGLLSLIALPVVSSLVAPSAAFSASGLLAQQATGCTLDSQCQPGNCTPTGSTGARTCCVAPNAHNGAILNGNSAGNGNNIGTPCGGTPTATRNTQCQSDVGTNCCSGNANYSNSPGTCNTFGGSAFFSCECL